MPLISNSLESASSVALTQVHKILHHCYNTVSSTPPHICHFLVAPPGTDIWTSRTVQSYITVTVHFLTEDWILDSRVLVTHEMMERHTGVNIAECLREIAKDWNLDNKVVAVVHDNASNMVLACDLLE